jgi:hypothetical protein
MRTPLYHFVALSPAVISWGRSAVDGALSKYEWPCSIACLSNSQAP